MRQDIKKAWIAELLNPETKQTIGALRRNEGECCLGVLCRVVKDQFGLPVEVRLQNGVWLFDDESFRLPERVVEFCGLKSQNPKVLLDNNTVETLAELNDSSFPFIDIADIIEQNEDL